MYMVFTDNLLQNQGSTIFAPPKQIPVPIEAYSLPGPARWAGS